MAASAALLAGFAASATRAQAGFLTCVEDPASLKHVKDAVQKISDHSPLGRHMAGLVTKDNFDVCIDPDMRRAGELITIPRPEGALKILRTPPAEDPDSIAGTIAHEFGHGLLTANTGSHFHLDVYGHATIRLCDEIMSRVISIVVANDMQQATGDDLWKHKASAENDMAVFYRDLINDLVAAGADPQTAANWAATAVFEAYLENQQLRDVYNDDFLMNEVARANRNPQGGQAALTREEFTRLGRLHNGYSVTEKVEVPAIDAVVGDNPKMKQALAALQAMRTGKGCDLQNPFIRADLRRAEEIFRENREKNGGRITMLNALERSIPRSQTPKPEFCP